MEVALWATVGCCFGRYGERVVEDGVFCMGAIMV